MPHVHVEITDEGAIDQQKADVIADMTAVLQRVLGKEPATTFVVIDEVPPANWGSVACPLSSGAPAAGRALAPMADCAPDRINRPI